MINKKEENMFFGFLYRKSTTTGFFKSLIERVSYKVFIKSLKKTSPDFDMLWQFADFVKLIELSSWYDNSKSNNVFSSTDYIDCENGFIISGNNHQLIFKLYDRNESITMNIRRNYAHKRNSEITFRNRELELKTQEDTVLMSNIIQETVDAMIKLFKEYYEKV